MRDEGFAMWTPAFAPRRLCYTAGLASVEEPLEEKNS
jgi:hypothetical protein